MSNIPFSAETLSLTNEIFDWIGEDCCDVYEVARRLEPKLKTVKQSRSKPMGNTQFSAKFEESHLDFGVDCYMVDRDGCKIMLIGATPDLTYHIVKAVNYHELLVEALRDLSEVFPPTASEEEFDALEKAHDLLKELEENNG